MSRKTLGKAAGRPNSEESVEMHLREGNPLVDEHALHRLDHGRRPGEVVVELPPPLANEVARALVDEASGPAPGRIRGRDRDLELEVLAEARERGQLLPTAHILRGAHAEKDVD